MRNNALVAAVLSLLLITAFFVWFSPGWLWLGGYAILAIVAALTVPVLYRLSGFTLADEMQWLEQREEQEHVEMQAELVDVRSQLAELDMSAGVRQADTLGQLLEDYHAVIDSRFRGKPESPFAYLSAARRVQNQLIVNLNDMVATQHSLRSIARHDTTEDAALELDDAQRQERFLSLQSNQQQRFDSLLSDNQELLDALTDTAVEVANIRTVSDFDRMDTLARLISLAEIASQTGK